MNPLAVAVQGLGFTAALVAVQGLLNFVADEVKKYESGLGGGGIKTRRRIVGLVPIQTPLRPVEEDEALLLIGLI